MNRNFDFIEDNLNELRRNVLRQLPSLLLWTAITVVCIVVYLIVTVTLIVSSGDASYHNSKTSRLKSFEGSHNHPFVFSVKKAKLKQFNGFETADPLVEEPCEELSLEEISNNLYSPRDGGPSYVLSNLFDVSNELITGKAIAAVSPKLFNVSGAECDAIRKISTPNATDDHAHTPHRGPNPCIITMHSNNMGVLDAVNPRYTPSKKSIASVLISEDLFPDQPPKWMEFYEHIRFTFRDWHTKKKIEEEVGGVDAFFIQASVDLLTRGRSQALQRNAAHTEGTPDNVICYKKKEGRKV